jgi:hypothetical protein
MKTMKLNLMYSLLLLFATTLLFTTSTERTYANDVKQPPSIDSKMGWLTGKWTSPASGVAGDGLGTNMSFQWAAGREVLLWKGTYASDESTWSFVATFFYDPKKERFRVFSFNSDGQRHLGVLTHAGPGRMVWKMSGLRSDGQIETFVMEFLHGQNDTLVFSMAERSPGDADGSDNTAITLRRTSDAKQDKDS